MKFLKYVEWSTCHFQVEYDYFFFLAACKNTISIPEQPVTYIAKAGAGLAASQWETSLQSNAVSYWLGANLESGLIAFNLYTCAMSFSVFPSLDIVWLPVSVIYGRVRTLWMGRPYPGFPIQQVSIESGTCAQRGLLGFLSVFIVSWLL